MLTSEAHFLVFSTCTFQATQSKTQRMPGKSKRNTTQITQIHGDQCINVSSHNQDFAEGASWSVALVQTRVCNNWSELQTISSVNKRTRYHGFLWFLFKHVVIAFLRRHWPAFEAFLEKYEYVRSHVFMSSQHRIKESNQDISRRMRRSWQPVLRSTSSL